MAMEELRGDRPDRLHPVRQRLPELRGPRGPQARGRHALRDPRRTDERPVRPRHPGRDRGRRRPDRPVRPGRPPAVVGRPPPRPELPGLPQQPLPVHRRPRAAARPDRAAPDRGRRAVHPPSRRVRPRPDARMGRAARTTSSPGLEGRRSPWTRRSRRRRAGGRWATSSRATSCSTRPGQPTVVVAATPPMLGRPCREVLFSDGQRIVADAVAPVA